MKGAAQAKAASDTAPGGGAETAPRPASLDALVSQVRERSGPEWLPAVYRERIMTMRTRSHPVPAGGANAPVEVLHTLLGIDSTKENIDSLGRPLPLVDGGKLIPGLLA